jgi:hypothetical protein
MYPTNAQMCGKGAITHLILIFAKPLLSIPQPGLPGNYEGVVGVAAGVSRLYLHIILVDNLHRVTHLICVVNSSTRLD